ncbi:MAG: hypothetical protein IPK33_06275 [Gemmatimonadetes bacterium]|nr:hypothetical protein [Gemmatimonadota bacterium]
MVIDNMLGGRSLGRAGAADGHLVFRGLLNTRGGVFRLEVAVIGAS